MLYLESFAHRVQLAEIVSRWIVNRPRVGDVALLKGIVNFNSYAATLWLDWFTTDLLTRVHGEVPKSFVATTKGVLKDYLVDHCTVHTPRVEELIARYRRFPEDFYRETPFGGRVYYLQNGGRPRFIGSTRSKRFRRIAEKGARRIIDFMFTHIRDGAEAFAAERAQKLGIPLSALITPYEEQVEEFRHAERRVLKAIRRGTIQSELPIMAIPDAAGLKILVEPERHEDVVKALRATAGAKVIEEEHHNGLYNATNVRMAVPFPREALRERAPASRALEVFRQRGFAPDEIEPRYHDFLDYAEEHVMLEAIVSTYADAVESEIGASMHEERVLAQRENPDYHGHFATNIRYLMDFVLGLCLAPSNDDLPDIPIKLWVRYMPDYPDVLMRRLLLDQLEFACDEEPPDLAAQ
jgi:hypothetical protein